MVISRTWDAQKIAEALMFLQKGQDNIDIVAWLADPKNIVLENADGDLALFEIGIKNIYSGHYYFKCRGRKAIDVGKAFLDELFNTCYNINVVMGMVPIQHLGARWMSRRLGFTSYGAEHLNDKHYELFILTKKEFNNG